MATVALTLDAVEQQECAGQRRSAPLEELQGLLLMTLEKKHLCELFLAAFVFRLKTQLLSGMKSPVMPCNIRESSAFWRNNY